MQLGAEPLKVAGALAATGVAAEGPQALGIGYRQPPLLFVDAGFEVEPVECRTPASQDRV